MLSLKRKKILIKSFIILGVSLLGLSLTKVLCLGDAKTPVLKEIKSVELLSIANDTTRLSAQIVLENPNSITITIHSMQADIFFKDTKIGKLNVIDSCQLPAGGTSQLKIMSYLQTNSFITAFSESKDSIPLTIKGNASVKALGMMFTKEIVMPFSFNLNSSIDKLLKEQSSSKKMIVTDKASIESLSLDNSIINISFHITNPYPLPVEIISYPSKIFINDKNVGSGDIVNPISVSKYDSTAKGEVKYNLNNFDLASTALSSLFQLKTEWEYRTEGELHIKVFGRELKLPYTGRGRLIKL